MDSVRNEHGDPRFSDFRIVRIFLPYSISNIVFIESLPFWILTILGLLVFASGDEKGFISFSIGILGLASGWCLIWYRALCGNKIAFIVLYTLYLPIIVSGIAYLISAALMIASAIFHLAQGQYQGLALLIGAAVVFVMAIIFLCNIAEKGLWKFVKLNGRCPVCRQWRFGRIKKPKTVTCGYCNATLEFFREEK
jgi:hypothetical protein